jgi:hypothetical protein
LPPVELLDGFVVFVRGVFCRGGSGRITLDCVLVGKHVWVDLMNFYVAPLEAMAPGAHRDVPGRGPEDGARATLPRSARGSARG